MTTVLPSYSALLNYSLPSPGQSLQFMIRHFSHLKPPTSINPSPHQFHCGSEDLVVLGTPPKCCFPEILQDSRRRVQPRSSPLCSRGAGSTADPGSRSLGRARQLTGGSGGGRTSYSACTISTSTHCSAAVAMVSRPTSGRRVGVASNSTGRGLVTSGNLEGGTAGSWASPRCLGVLYTDGLL